MDSDIIIVGAGPSGLSTGLNLLNLDPSLAKRTLILECEHHPREKLCAGGLLPAVDAQLERLNIDLSSIPSTPVSEIHLYYRGRQSIIRRKPFAFRTIQRDQFDAHLASIARDRGLLIQEGVRVRHIRPVDSGVELDTDNGIYHAQVIVGADGSNSVVRKSVFGNQGVSQVARLVEIRQPSTGKFSQDHALFDFSWIDRGLQGYLWNFPTPANSAPKRTWGVYDSRVYPGLAHCSLKETLAQGLIHHRGAADEYSLAGHPLRWYHPRAPISAPRVLLVGDAAGTGAVVGEGISFALGYGEVAAVAIQDAFTRHDWRFSDYGYRIRQHRTGRYLYRRFLAARLLYGIRISWLYHLLWPLLGWLTSTFFIDWDNGQ